MKLHPRHVAREEARLELLSFLIDWSRKHKLTLAERHALLASGLSESHWLVLKRKPEDEP